MRIKSQLRLAAWLPALLALLVGGVLWFTMVRVDRAQQDAQAAEKTLRFNFELNILTQEFLLYGGARVEHQMRIHHQAMGRLLEALPAREPEEHELITTMKNNHQELGTFYDLLLRGRPTAREPLVGILLVKAQDIRAKARQYAAIQHLQVMHYQRAADSVVMVGIALLATTSLLLLTLLSRRLMRGIGQLGDGVRHIASGELGHLVKLDSADELGALAQAFNQMNRRLGDSYTSIDQLRLEISRREAAELATRQLNTELESRVRQRTAELEAANKELEAFAYSVSHDLRAPLRAVDGFSRKVMAVYGDRVDAEGRRLLQVVRDSAQQMGQLIDDLLAFSRMGRREMSWKPLDMSAMARGVAEQLQALEPERQICFTFLDLPQVSGDAAMLRQVWVNLISNAVKFTKQNEVAHIEVGGSTEGTERRYWVKDDGAGFDMQYAGKLFGVFQRLHRQDEFEGTGVGLAIAQRIVLRHHGRIWGEGEPGLGAIFSFTLPLAAPGSPHSGDQK